MRFAFIPLACLYIYLSIMNWKKNPFLPSDIPKFTSSLSSRSHWLLSLHMDVIQAPESDVYKTSLDCHHPCPTLTFLGSSASQFMSHCNHHNSRNYLWLHCHYIVFLTLIISRKSVISFSKMYFFTSVLLQNRPWSSLHLTWTPAIAS